MIFSFPTLGLASEANLNTDQENISSIDISKIETNEPAIPLLKSKSVLTSNTIQLPERKAWVATTTAELEKAYGQKILNVEETQDVIRFVYETRDYEPRAELVNEDGIPCTPQQLLMTEYTKPESNLAAKLSSSASPRALSTKINYYYEWSAYYNLQRKGAQSFNAAYNVAILIAGAVTKPLASVVISVATWLGDSVLNSQPVEAETKVKYYYQTKAGCVLANGVWTATVQVGCRKGFGHWWASYRNSYNEPIADWSAPHNANNSTNPSNQDSVEYKANFNNNTWILNKAIECYNSGVPYVDIYGIASKPIP